MSLVIVTFVLLFLGLSTEIGKLNTYKELSAKEITSLKERVANLEELNGVTTDVGKEDTPVQPGTTLLTPTYVNEVSSVTNLKSKFGSLELAPNPTFWTYAFDSEKILSETERFVMIGNADGSMSYVVFYQSNQGNNGDYKIFGLAPFSDTEKRLVLTNALRTSENYFKDKPKTSALRNTMIGASNITNAAVFVDGKVVLFHDFKDGNKAALKELLTSIQSSNDSVPAIVKQAAQSELRSIQF